LLYSISGSKAANKPVSTITHNAVEQSKIGVKIEEKIAEGGRPSPS
jgi:hypothetical protein